MIIGGRSNLMLKIDSISTRFVNENLQKQIQITGYFPDKYLSVEKGCCGEGYLLAHSVCASC
jgi:hypothetical protein